MDDQELADKVAALGIGHHSERDEEFRPGVFEHIHDYWLYESEADNKMSAYGFIRDWRVAGACLQAWPTTINTENLDMTLDEMLRDPRAIIEACVEALGDNYDV